MIIDYYFFSLNRIHKKSIDTDSEYYISHDNQSVKISVYNPFDYNMEERTYSTDFETVKNSAIIYLTKKLENEQKELDILKNSTKAFNDS